MNYYVPDFEMDDDQHLISSSTTDTRHKAEDDILELLWHDGQVVAQPQNQRKSQPSTIAPSAPAQTQYQQQQQLYMAEDEMATWLHYPLEDLYSDLLCENPTSAPPPPVATVNKPQEIRPPAVPPVRLPVYPPPTAVSKPPMKNFQLFSRMRGKDPEMSSNVRPDLTVVESNTTPALATVKSIGEVSSAFPGGAGGGGGGGGGERLLEGGGSGEMTVSSSSGYSGGPANTTTAVTASEDAGEKVIRCEVEDRKRKLREIDESATPTTATDQDLELEPYDDDEKKHSRVSHGSKRSRAAEVHNLSERRRRDRINEKMKALQELIPRCNKSDKASMLDEAIEYLKSLQMQVQMMSMGCGMVPMMYPGMQQQYMPPMGLGMGMDMGMSRPMMPFPSNIPCSNLNTPAVAAGPQFAPRFIVPPMRLPPAPASNFAVSQASNQADSARSSFPVQGPGLPQLPNMADPYQQYMALQQMQMHMQMQMQMQAVQNQSISKPGSSKPTSTSKSEGQPGPSTSKSEAEDDQ